MNRKSTTPIFLLAAVTSFAVTTASPKAAEISISTTAPTVDGDDIANLVDPTGRQKWFDDVEHDAGQTFTPAADGLLRSFTIFLSDPNLNDAEDENVDLRLVSISRPDGEFTITDLYTENAVMAPSPGGDWEADDYITFTYDTPQEVSAGVEYGIITDAQKMGSWQDGGIPYRHRSGNDYDGGALINRGGEASNSDLIFHIDIGKPGETESFEITEFTYSPDDNTITLTWESEPEKSYLVKYSRDLGKWDDPQDGDLDDGAVGDEGPTTTRTYNLANADLQDEGRVYFRVELDE